MVNYLVFFVKHGTVHSEKLANIAVIFNISTEKRN